MLRLHEGPDDYCVLFDVHDDIVSLNHPTAPTSAKFYQVKTKTTGTWTAEALVRSEKSKKTNEPLPSFLGKLYDHRVKFSVHVDRLAFVSNARFDVTMADASNSKERESICVADLALAEITTISDALTAEYKLTTPPTGLDSTYLETTSLSLVDHENHSVGVVAAFLEKQGDGTIPPAPFHKTLKADIQRRTNKEGIVSGFADMVKHRGLTRQQVQGMIDSVMSKGRQDDLVAILTGQLNAEPFDARRRLTIIGDARKYLAQRLDATNLILDDARKAIEAELSDIPANAFTSPTVIADTITRLSALPRKEWTAVRNNYSDAFLNAMFAVHIYEQELPPTGPQPEEENV
jgi:hypothetical protein